MWLRSVSDSHVAKDYELELLILFFPSLKFGDYRHELLTRCMWC
uniref:Uncharacterized protein n=1 Tax=Anguilla anguilla TaxID=7936 RepID=A0A0E9TWQ2_ANGAN